MNNSAPRRRIVVTGANKGIGFALVGRLLAEHPDTFVFLGSRSEARGTAARQALVDTDDDWADRVEVLPLDVADESSVTDAARRVAERFPQEPQPLYGLVNNAGIGRHGHTLQQVLSVNARGPRRVCDAFAPLLQKGGRIVIVTSASGPNYVKECSEAKQRFFTRADLTWNELDALMKQCAELEGDEAFAARGLGSADAYGLSKACANAYMQIAAREHPALAVNACTPGFIETDMTKPYAQSAGKSAADMGMKTPHEGASAPLHLLLGELEGNGWYYGSDAERSPLDRYRSPGSPAYQGDD